MCRRHPGKTSRTSTPFHIPQEIPMTISAVSNSFSIAQLTQVGSSKQSSAGCSVDGSTSSQPSAGGGLVDAIVQALSHIGVTGSGSSTSTGSSSSDASSSSDSSSTNSSSSTADIGQALGAFLQNLLQNLHAQSASSSTSDSTNSDSSTSISTVSATAGNRPSPPPGGGPAQLQSDLQSLISELSSSSSASGTSSASTTASDTGSTSALQQSFQNLLGALGESGSSKTLNNFLQALSQNLSANSGSGNLVNTQA
jgi:hypothetical protein